MSLASGRRVKVQARIAAQLRTHAATVLAFRHNGMPWRGDLCVSKFAGLSGLAYALPALASISLPEQICWLISAWLSVMADYVHIHEDSVFHGLDRSYASLQMLRCLVLGAMHLEPFTALALAAIPLGCFVCGRDAKALPEPSAWVFWHTLWHISGGLLLWFGTYVMHHQAADAGIILPTVNYIADAVAYTYAY